MNRRHLLAAPLVAVPVAATATPAVSALPDATAARVFSVMARAFCEARAGLPVSPAALREQFERIVAPLPYTFRSGSDNRPVQVIGLNARGRMIFRKEDGTVIGHYA